MRRATITKRATQLVALLYGVFGCVLGYVAAESLIGGISTANRAQALFAGVFFIMSVLFLAVAYQNLLRFGSSSLRNISAVTALIITAQLSSLLGPGSLGWQMPAAFAVAVLVGVASHWLLSRYLVVLSGAGSNPVNE